MKPTEKQIDFATTISETVGADLPEEFTKEAYHDFIDEYVDEFYELQREIRRESGRTFRLHHSYVLNDGFCGDSILNKNPGTV